MPEATLNVNLILIPSPHALARNYASLFQLGDDALYSSLGDTYEDSDVPQASERVASKADKDV